MDVTEEEIKQLQEVAATIGGTPYGESKRTKALTIKIYPVTHALVTKFYPNKLARMIEGMLLEQMEKDGFIPPVMPKKQRGAEPAGMDTYAAAKKAEKIALEEIKERSEKAAPAKSKKR